MRTAVLVVALCGRAAAGPDQLQPQVLIDFGLAVIGAAYEHPVTNHVALLLEAHVHGTYFLPWFDLGDKRAGPRHRSAPDVVRERERPWFYACAYARADAVSIDRGALNAKGFGTSEGLVAGWTFGLGAKLDLRLGLGVQYIYLGGDANGTHLGASTLFPTIDGLLGYRL